MLEGVLQRFGTFALILLVVGIIFGVVYILSDYTVTIEVPNGNGTVTKTFNLIPAGIRSAIGLLGSFVGIAALISVFVLLIFLLLPLMGFGWRRGQ